MNLSIFLNFTNVREDLVYTDFSKYAMIHWKSTHRKNKANSSP